jgi:catechol 2,3-dioxygenase-like lactoylglutathione lyase family enzyme
MIRGLHHTAISTPDIDRLVRFYRDVIGFRVAWETEWNPGDEVADQILDLKDSSARLVMLEAGNTYLELFQYASPEPEPGDPRRPVCDHGVTHICLDVVGVDEEYERLLAAGMVFHSPPHSVYDVRTTYGRDPDGNVVEVQEVLVPDSPMRPLDTSMLGVSGD